MSSFEIWHLTVRHITFSLRHNFYNAKEMVCGVGCGFRIPVRVRPTRTFQRRNFTRRNHRICHTDRRALREAIFPSVSGSRTIRFKARFDSSAVYTTLQAENQGDINKLFGVSDCNSSHQVNSARFGWRWYNLRLEILAYVYINGTRKWEYITSVQINSVHNYEILVTDSSYVFNVDTSSIALPRGCAGKLDGYKLYPYFGGDEKAPHTITIEIEELIDQESP